VLIDRVRAWEIRQDIDASRGAKANTLTAGYKMEKVKLKT
jgi:hypothetical protein